MFFTVPVSTMPSFSTSSVCFFFSSRSSSRTERRESTTLPRRRVSLVTFARIFWPTIQARFFTRRRSPREPGRDAFTPTSTAEPPLPASPTLPFPELPCPRAFLEPVPHAFLRFCALHARTAEVPPVILRHAARSSPQ